MNHEFENLEFLINGVQTNVKVVGRGREVLYLHGGSTLEGFDFALGFADRCRIYCPSHPGMGDSGDAPHITSMNDMVIHYLNLIDELGFQHKPHLIGFSMGGWMAAELAGVAREKFDKVVFLAPDGLSDSTCRSPDWGDITPGDLPSYLTHDKRVAEKYFPQGPGMDAAFDAQRAREEEVVGRIYGAVGGAPANVRFLTARITNSTLVVWGDQDKLMPFAQSAFWLDSLPNARLIAVPNAGHLILQEVPSAVGTVVDFLAAD